MLSSSTVEANVPAADLQRARAFYEGVLGLEPMFDMAGVWVRYGVGSTFLNVYETTYAGQAGHTIAQWHVDDVAAEVRDLKAKGVSFQVYDDMPGTEWDGEIATLGGQMKSAWFTDTEGNVMCLDEMPADMRASAG
jgi:catechol 2,3-dioxygenase-like lactoylglutathione lyase family enzyme